MLSLSEGVVTVSSFIRNMILARLLTKADFGIAATFAMTISLFELTAKMGVGRILISDKSGDEPEFLATGHLVQFVVGLLSSVIIAAAAWPLSRLFGIPDQTGAIMFLALVPFLRGLVNLDIRRFERDLRFGPGALCEIIPSVCVTLLAWPLARWLGDYRAVLAILLIKVLLGGVASHWLAERRYRWQAEHEYILRMARFGWPLVLNGFLMFGVLQGEQFLVATYYSMADLAPYAAAAALVMAPTYFFMRVSSPIMLPVLAKAQDDKELSHRRYRQVVSVMALIAAVSSVGLVIGAEALMRLVYGQKYVGGGIIMAGLAATSAVRTIRIATSVAALAKSDSQNEMWSNGGRVIGLLPALALAIFQQPLWMVAYTGLSGEAVACSVAILRLRRRDGIPLSASLAPLGWIVALLAVAGTVAWLGTYRLEPLWGLLCAVTAAVISGGLTVLVLPELRREAMTVWTVLRTEGWQRFISPLRGRQGTKAEEVTP